MNTDKDIAVKPLVANVRSRSHDVLEDCFSEMERQVEKWGEQHLPDIPMTHGALELLPPTHVVKHHVDGLASAGRSNWALIALKELCEAADEGHAKNNKALYTELIQTAAVLLSWARDVKSRA